DGPRQAARASTIGASRGPGSTGSPDGRRQSRWSLGAAAAGRDGDPRSNPGPAWSQPRRRVGSDRPNPGAGDRGRRPAGAADHRPPPRWGGAGAAGQDPGGRARLAGRVAPCAAHCRRQERAPATRRRRQPVPRAAPL
ncbi:MAG: hypothetical protein AVDCRST_MAG62-684, partial [uncultured Sphingomonas sp.]